MNFRVAEKLLSLNLRSGKELKGSELIGEQKGGRKIFPRLASRSRVGLNCWQNL